MNDLPAQITVPVRYMAMDQFVMAVNQPGVAVNFIPIQTLDDQPTTRVGVFDSQNCCFVTYARNGERVPSEKPNLRLAGQ